METENEAESKIKLVKQMSPLTWAYLGDSIFETYIRDYLVDTTNLKPNKLHRKAIMYVKAKAQADVIKKLDAYLTDEEKWINVDTTFYISGDYFDSNLFYEDHIEEEIAGEW